MPDTSVTGRVWPEDTGTGAANGNEDWDSAGYIAGMAAKDNASDYVEAGLGITPNYGTPAFDLAPGLAYIKYTGSVSIQLPSDDATTYSGTWDQGVTFAVDVDAENGIALTDSAVNRVYLAADLTSNDTAYVRVDTEASPNVPSDPHVKIAEIDTSADSTTEVNREPSATFDSLTANDATTDSLSTDVAAIGNHPNVKGVESGVVTNSTSLASTNDNWSDREFTGVSTSFNTSFDSTPELFVQINDANTANAYGVLASYTNLSTSGFDMVFSCYISAGSSNQEAHYLAVETA